MYFDINYLYPSLSLKVPRAMYLYIGIKPYILINKNFKVKKKKSKGLPIHNQITNSSTGKTCQPSKLASVVLVVNISLQYLASRRNLAIIIWCHRL